MLLWPMAGQTMARWQIQVEKEEERKQNWADPVF